MSFYLSEKLNENTDHASINTHLSQGKLMERQKRHIIETNLTEGFDDYTKQIKESEENTTLFSKFKSIVTNLTRSEPTSTIGSKYVKDQSDNYFYITGNNVMKRTYPPSALVGSLTASGNLLNIGSFFTTISGENVIRGTDICYNTMDTTKYSNIPKYFVANEIFADSNTMGFDLTKNNCSHFDNYDISKNGIESPYECMNQAILNGKQYAMLKNKICFLSNTNNTIYKSDNDNYKDYVEKCDSSSNMSYGYRYDLSGVGQPHLFGKSGYINGNLEYESTQLMFNGDTSYNELKNRRKVRNKDLDISCGNAADCELKCKYNRSCWGYSVSSNDGWTFDTSTILKDTITYDDVYNTYLRKKKYTEGLTTSDLTTNDLNVFQSASGNFLKKFVKNNDVKDLIDKMDALNLTITQNLIDLNRQYNINNERLNQSIKTTSSDVSNNLLSKTSKERSVKDEYAELLNKLDDEILQINRQSYEHLGWSLVVICLVIVSIKLLNSNS